MEEKDLKLKDLVAFKWEGKTQFGRVTSIEDGVANIKGVEQESYTRPAYHVRVVELQPAYIHYSTKPVLD